MDNKSEFKKSMLSGIQPTGIFTLGNYIGAIKNWSHLQEEYNCIFFIANLHSLTVRMDNKKRKEQTLDAIALLLACGIDVEKSVLFAQSDLPQHAELNWILQCYTQFGELSRMTQFKDKSQKHPENINVGLFGYPVLMAADILLYQPDFVPIGSDQKQHLELTRNVAERFNSLYGKTFKVPEPYIPEHGARIMSLSNPKKKMSKSDENQNGCIYLLDTPEQIVKKFKRAVTDSETEICYREGKEGINNLMTIYSTLTDRSFADIEKEFSNKGYGYFKTVVGECVVEAFRHIRENFALYRKDEQFLIKTVKKGADKASVYATDTIEKVYRKLGLL